MMNKLIFNLRLQSPSFRHRRAIVFAILFIALGFATPRPLLAHQQPTTIVMLDVSSDKVLMELQIPLSELELAFGHDVSQNSEALVERLQPQLTDYLLAHIHPTTADNEPWAVTVTNLKIAEAEQTQSGSYQEATIHLLLKPPVNAVTRHFILNYDVIMHQVVSHKALVGIRRDWEAGKTGEQPVTTGVIMVDTKTTLINPLEINLQKGGWLTGFQGMIELGMRHIREGTDHLLFLLTLLPATLLVSGGRWGNFGGAQNTFRQLLKIVTAFTVGHSITLIFGALGWLQLPQQPVEVLIAVSILISAVHAVRPIFPGREIYVAAGFGLIHGLAFASVLSDLNLGAGETALSILGFNLGIELMQLAVVALIVPWLILLSLTPFYQWVRITAASAAAVAAIAWIIERVSGNQNAVGNLIQHISEYAHIGILLLAVISLSAYGWQFSKNKHYFVKSQEAD